MVDPFRLNPPGEPPDPHGEHLNKYTYKESLQASIVTGVLVGKRGWSTLNPQYGARFLFDRDIVEAVYFGHLPRAYKLASQRYPSAEIRLDGLEVVAVPQGIRFKIFSTRFGEKVRLYKESEYNHHVHCVGLDFPSYFDWYMA